MWVAFLSTKAFPHSSNNTLLFEHCPHAVQAGCHLCTAIWQQSLKQIPQLITFQTKDHVWDEYNEPIYLGLSDWTPEADGMPYLIAVQHLPRGAMRNLASFEVYVESEDGPFEFGQLLARAVQSGPSLRTEYQDHAVMAL